MEYLKNQCVFSERFVITLTVFTQRSLLNNMCIIHTGLTLDVVLYETGIMLALGSFAKLRGQCFQLQLSYDLCFNKHNNTFITVTTNTILVQPVCGNSTVHIPLHGPLEGTYCYTLTTLCGDDVFGKVLTGNLTAIPDNSVITPPTEGVWV